jgi:hypothetical protein
MSDEVEESKLDYKSTVFQTRALLTTEEPSFINVT